MSKFWHKTVAKPHIPLNLNQGADFKSSIFLDIILIQCVTIEFRQGPVYEVNLQFLRCLD